MLPVTARSARLFLHILGATVWIGGQLTLGALVPTVRQAGADVVRDVARRFQLLAWPGFGLLVASGVWNVLDADLGSQNRAYLVTLSVKLVFVALSGAAAALHTFGAGPRVRAATDARAVRRARAWSGGLASAALLFALGGRVSRRDAHLTHGAATADSGSDHPRYGANINRSFARLSRLIRVTRPAIRAPMAPARIRRLRGWVA